jgi:hypothetical protein
MSQLNVSEKSKGSLSSLDQNSDILTIIPSERIKLLQREIGMIRELLGIEPDSKCLYKLKFLESQIL